VTAEEEPTRRQIVFEIVVFALLVALAGGVFVALRVAREGDRVVQFDLRPPR
jgi:hypothetical protein